MMSKSDNPDTRIITNIVAITIIALSLIPCLAHTNPSNAPNVLTPNKENTMKLNAGIITDKLSETKAFYSQVLHFGVRFENDFYLLMHTSDESAEISFLLPNHPSQGPIFHTPFDGKGVYLTIEVDDVDAVYQQMQQKGVAIAIEIRDEPWGDRHFAITDPNGIGIDIVTFTEPE